MRPLHFDEDAHCGKCATPHCCTISARSRFPNTSSAKRKKLPDGQLDAIRLRFLLAINQIETLSARRKFELLQTGVGIDDRLMLEDRSGYHRRARANCKRCYRNRRIGQRTARGRRRDRRAARFDSGQNVSRRRRRKARCSTPPSSISYASRAARSPTTSVRRWSSTSRSRFIFLREIPWAKTPWRNVPDLAYGHHEHLDGTGYPRGLKKRRDRAASSHAHDRRRLRRANR